jgi:hypothetical protein
MGLAGRRATQCKGAGKPYQSRGMKITKNRMELLNRYSAVHTYAVVEDIKELN